MSDLKESIFIETLGKTKDGKINVKLGIFYIASFNKEESGLYTFSIPSIDICFTAESEEQGKELAKSATAAFLTYWGEERSKFMMRIKVLGFMPAHDMWQSIMKKQRYANADFTYKGVSKEAKMNILLNRYHDKVEIAL